MMRICLFLEIENLLLILIDANIDPAKISGDSRWNIVTCHHQCFQYQQIPIPFILDIIGGLLSCQAKPS
jgi:hypothetical protein